MKEQEKEEAGLPSALPTEAHQKLAYLTAQIQKSFDFYLARKDNNKLKAFRIKMVEVIFSAVISILAGVSLLDSEYSHIVNIAILVLGGSITAFAAWDNFYNHKELWVKYTDYAIRLNAMKVEAEYLRLRGKSLEVEQVDELFTRYKMILEEVAQSWVYMRSRQEEDSKKAAEAAASLNK